MSAPLDPPLDPETVALRLEALRRLVVTVTGEEARAWMEGGCISEARGTSADPDFAAKVQHRLDELRALCELTNYLHASRVR